MKNNKINQAFLWIYPGLGIKRWVSLIILGVIIWSVGAIFIVGKNIPTEFYFFVKKYIRQGVFGISASLFGIFLIIIGIINLNRSILYPFIKNKKQKLVNMIFKEKCLKKGLRLTAIGGGTGLYTLLRGIKEYTSNITAIVTVSDDGGSSGKLREELNILPPGDIRNCLVALADSEENIANLIQYRFNKEGLLKGQCIGNLLIAALTEMEGDFYNAIKQMSSVLAIRGKVIPSTLENVVLCAELEDGTIIRGESKIELQNSKIQRVFLHPPNIKALPDAIEAIQNCDALIIGPGSLYSSIISNLIIPGISSAIQNSKCVKIYICNVMTQPGETEGYTAFDHIKTVSKYIGGFKYLDYAIVNTQMPSILFDKYKARKSLPVKIDLKALKKLPIEIIYSKVISENDWIRHDSYKLAEKIFEILQKHYPYNIFLSL